MHDLTSGKEKAAMKSMALVWRSGRGQKVGVSAQEGLERGHLCHVYVCVCVCVCVCPLQK